MMRIIKQIISSTSVIIGLAVAIAFPNMALVAQASAAPQQQIVATACTQTNCDLVAKYVSPLIQVLTGLVGIIAAASIIYGGIQYSSAGGDPQKVNEAKNRITNTILALVGYAFLYGFLQFIVPGGVFAQ